MPNRSPASTMSSPSVYSVPGGSPQCSITEARSAAGSPANQRSYSARDTRIGAAASCASVSHSVSCPPAAISVWISSSPSSGKPAPRSYAAARRQRSSETADAGVSKPTALPTRACLVGYADSMIASRRSGAGRWLSRACATAIPATRAARSGSATYTGTPSSPASLNENGTVISRPSNSGTATCIAASIGVSAALESAQAARDEVRHSACRTGTSSSASAATSQASSSPPAVASLATVPPAASMVTISASTPARRSYTSAPADRSDEQNTGRALAPCASTASASASTNAVLPETACAR